MLNKSLLASSCHEKYTMIFENYKLLYNDTINLRTPHNSAGNQRIVFKKLYFINFIYNEEETVL